MSVKLTSRLQWMMFSRSPLLIFIVLFLISHLVYLRFFSRLKPGIANGSIVMAIGIFGLACLPQFHVHSSVLLVFALELVIIWIYLAVGLVQSYLAEKLRFDHLSDRLGVGTWVAGTVATVLLLDLAEHTLHGFIVLLGMIAVILYLFYLAVLAQWYTAVIRKKLHLQSNGMVLLATVSTQSIVLLFAELFHEEISPWIYQSLIMLGMVFYLTGLYTILHYLFRARSRHLIASWFNANCIHHGAISITGLAILQTQVFPAWLGIIFWWLAIVSFFVIEAIEIGRMVIRVKLKGIREGIFVYDTSQWTRNFTFGMLYAFTLSYYNLDYSRNWLVTTIANDGQYVVAALLLVQIGIFMLYAFTEEKNA